MPNQEQLKQYSAEEIKKIEAMRRRVSALGENNLSGDDAVYDLAKKEDEFRTNPSPDAFSTEALERAEALKKIDEMQKELTEAEEKAMVDPLTGLGNRRAMEKIASAILRIGRSSSPAVKDTRNPNFEEKRKPPVHSLIILDLDFFKKINDTYGHPAGDKVLKKIAETLNRIIRKEGSVYRHGGEEFAIFLPHTNFKEAAKAAERIREAIEKLSIEIDENRKINITASLGCASTEQISGEASKEKILGAMIGNSDAALYQSKESGRNKVSVFELRSKDK